MYLQTNEVVCQASHADSKAVLTGRLVESSSPGLIIDLLALNPPPSPRRLTNYK